MASGEEEQQGWERIEAYAWEEAETHFRRALQEDPFRPDALTGIAALYLQAGDPEQARELCEMAVAQAEHDLPRSKRHQGWDDPKVRPYLRALYYLSLSYIEQDAWSLAQPTLEEIVVWDATGMNGKALDLLGQVFLRIGRVDEAAQAFLEAAEFRAQAHFSAGLAMFLRGRYRDAERLWAKGIEQRPQLAEWLMYAPKVRPLPLVVPDATDYNESVQYWEYMDELWARAAREALQAVYQRQAASIG
jgi:tetratricopeptide (TPR) repeat protein